MPCHGCATNFSFFLKEHTCPNCGFSFCSKCLKGRITNDEKIQKVCSSCYKILTNTASSSGANFDPPALLLKRLETLENPAKPPITIFKQKGKLLNLKAGLDPEDRQIMERLERLKEGRKVQKPPSETEIKQRLMILKGLNADNLNEKQHLIQPPPKSEQEEADDLLKQFVNEMNIEGKIIEEGVKCLQNIEGRLQKLHSADGTGVQRSPNSICEDDGDSVSKRIIEKVIAEAKLEKKLEDSILTSDDEDNISVDLEEESELQWCIICNEDASIKCLNCDGSLYCNICFKQGHEFFNMEDHKTVKLDTEKS